MFDSLSIQLLCEGISTIVHRPFPAVLESFTGKDGEGNETQLSQADRRGTMTQLVVTLQMQQVRALLNLFVLFSDLALPGFEHHPGRALL